MNHEIHEVHEKAETLADIRKEAEARFRELLEKHVDSLGHIQAMQQFNQVFDRIEAAWKRERGEIEANALAVGGVVEAARNKPSGNSAAMREALRTLRQRFDNNVMAYQDRYFKFSGWHWHKKAAEAARWRDLFSELREACDTALAAPPRNCDRDLSDTQSIFAEFRQWVHASSLGCVSEPSASDAFRWLLAPANEKGDDDASK